MNFTDNEQIGSVSPEETVTYPTGPVTEPSVEEAPVFEDIRQEEYAAPQPNVAPEPYITLEPYERTVLPGSDPRDRAKKYIILTIVSACIIVALIAGFIFYYITTDSRIRGLEEDINHLARDKRLLEEEKSTITSDYEYEISTLHDEIAILEDEISELSKKADFMDKFIKVVEDDAYNTYHTYGCEYFDDSHFWAYNEAQVINNSKYTRCPYCN